MYLVDGLGMDEQNDQNQDADGTANFVTALFARQFTYSSYSRATLYQANTKS